MLRFRSNIRAKRRWTSLLAVVVLVAAADQAAAFPITSEKAWNPALSATILADGFTYNGIIALSNCSGSFVKFKGASPDALGLILTNGHCTGGGSLWRRNAAARRGVLSKSSVV